MLNTKILYLILIIKIHIINLRQTTISPNILPQIQNQH